jgi:hypothetical protein
MIYLFVVIIGGLGTLAYLAIMFNAVPGAMDERLGHYEALPEDLGEWRHDVTSSEGIAMTSQGKRLEHRYLLETGGFLKGQTLVKQSRVRDLASNEIIEVRAEERTKRRRRQA